LTRQAKSGPSAAAYPEALNTSAKRALYDNLAKIESLAVEVDDAIRSSMQDDWRGNALKIKRVKHAIKGVLEDRRNEGAVASGMTQSNIVIEGEEPYNRPRVDAVNRLADDLLELAKNQNEY